MTEDPNQEPNSTEPEIPEDDPEEEISEVEEMEQNPRIKNTEIRHEMSKSYIDYAMSVIIGRAIPDVRDGLKPVQKRLLYSMYENNFTHKSPHRKCARIVGDTMGKYHPHGDQAVYQTLVRMTQDFSVRYPPIDGQGNFGSIDGDAAAAMRYTEARLAKISDEMLADLNKNTVDFVDNFDSSLQEPAILPAKIPQLLLNGATGIAVGMSTNIAPHNLNEVANAIAAAVDMGPEKLEPQDVIKHIKGPDFPTGGYIMGQQGITNAIHTGYGAIVIRSKTEIVANGAGKNKDAIIVTEIPYMVNKARLIKSIADFVNKGVMPEISDIRDESDRKGMRIVIEMKQKADTKACLNRLFQRTQLQNSFHILNLALVENGLKPQVLNYAEIIQEFIKHREIIIRRRTEFDLKKAQNRLHIIEGLLIAINNIDEIIPLIKNSKDRDEAKQKLTKEFNLTDIQADEILKMPLSRLTNLQTQRLEDEKLELIATIEELNKILNDRNIRLQIVKDETLEMAKIYGDERRSLIKEAIDTDEEAKIIETIPEEDCVIMITQNQSIKRMELKTYQAQNRGGKGKIGMKMREEDIVMDMFIASSHDTILLFTQQGRVYSIPAYKIPKGSRNAKGKAIVNYVDLKPGEQVIDLTAISKFDESRTLVFVTKFGKIKKVTLDQFAKIRKTGIKCAKVRDGDELMRVKLCHPDDHVLIVTADGYAIHFEESELRPMGRSAMGVNGITLREEDEVVDLIVDKEETSIVTITQNGFGKLSALELYRLTHRAGKGVINIKLRHAEDRVIAAKAIHGDKNLLLASVNGIIIRIRSNEIRETGRAAKGVIVMRLDEDDSVGSVALCDADEPDEC